MQARLLINGRLLTALTMLIIFVSMSVISLGFPEKARLLPLMVGIPGSILALIQFFLEFRAAVKELDNVDEKVREEHKAEVLMFTWMFLFFIGILSFGFIYAAPVLVSGFLYLAKKEGLKTALIGGVGTWVVLYWFFQYWFEIQLFNGLVTRWLFG